MPQPGSLVESVTGAAPGAGYQPYAAEDTAHQPALLAEDPTAQTVGFVQRLGDVGRALTSEVRTVFRDSYESVDGELLLAPELGTTAIAAAQAETPAPARHRMLGKILGWGAGSGTAALVATAGLAAAEGGGTVTSASTRDVANSERIIDSRCAVVKTNNKPRELSVHVEKPRDTTTFKGMSASAILTTTVDGAGEVAKSILTITHSKGARPAAATVHRPGTKTTDAVLVSSVKPTTRKTPSGKTLVTWKYNVTGKPTDASGANGRTTPKNARVCVVPSKKASS